MRIKKFTWKDFDDAVRKLTFRIKAVKGATGIYGEPRGGLCLAVALSHHTGLPLVKKPGPGVVWVDDIADKGHTLMRADCDGSIARFVWMEKKHNPIPVASVITVPNKCWVVFPWEDPDKAQSDFNSYNAKSF